MHSFVNAMHIAIVFGFTIIRQNVTVIVILALRGARAPYKQCIGNRDTLTMSVLPIPTLSGAL